MTFGKVLNKLLCPHLMKLTFCNYLTLEFHVFLEIILHLETIGLLSDLFQGFPVRHSKKKVV